MKIKDNDFKPIKDDEEIPFEQMELDALAKKHE